MLRDGFLTEAQALNQVTQAESQLASIQAADPYRFNGGPDNYAMALQGAATALQQARQRLSCVQSGELVKL